MYFGLSTKSNMDKLSKDNSMYELKRKRKVVNSLFKDFEWLGGK